MNFLYSDLVQTLHNHSLTTSAALFVLHLSLFPHCFASIRCFSSQNLNRQKIEQISRSWPHGLALRYCPLHRCHTVYPKIQVPYFYSLKVKAADSTMDLTYTKLLKEVFHNIFIRPFFCVHALLVQLGSVHCAVFHYLVTSSNNPTCTKTRTSCVTSEDVTCSATSQV